MTQIIDAEDPRAVATTRAIQRGDVSRFRELLAELPDRPRQRSARPARTA
jgi:hypothetical protein